jgi:transglutaminase-like putative cysteine protease
MARFSHWTRYSDPAPRYSLEEVGTMSTQLARFVGWLIRRVGAQSLLALALLWAALGSVCLGLADVLQGVDVSLMMVAMTAGVLLGWLLAKLPLPGWLSGLLALILGVEWHFVRVGQLGRSLCELLRFLLELVWQLAQWTFGRWPDWTPASRALLALLELGSGVSVLVGRVFNWLLALAVGQTAFDPLAVVLVWGIALWAMAVWASWAVRRHAWVLPGLVPAAGLLVFTLSYTWAPAHYLITWIGAMWLLQALIQHAARERRWAAERVDFSLDIRFGLAMAALGLSLLIMVTAMLLPSLSVQRVVELAQDVFGRHEGEGSQVADSLGLERRPNPTTFFGQASTGGLPRSHLLGSSPELSKQLVMRVYVEGLTPIHATSVDALSLMHIPHYYWRGISYDVYTGVGWRTSEIESVGYVAGEMALSPGESQRVVRQKVESLGGLGGTLYATGELLTADHDYRVAWRTPGDAFGAYVNVADYWADSLVATASEEQLRGSGGDYPDWVRERYLALPGDVPQRVVALGRDLTATEPTPYERALAIERYLRTFSYTLDLPAFPLDRDVADYFLFDLKRGYCDYYATAMVVLARAAGLPARLVTGYASGSYDATQARFVVTEADAHAWVEIYFTGYGWIEFEPTAALPARDRSGAARSSPIAPLPSHPPPARWRSNLDWLVLPGVLGALALVLVGSVTWWLTDDWRLSRKAPMVVITTLYRRLGHHGQRLAVPPRPGSTPHEFTVALAAHVVELASGRRYARLVASAPQEVSRLTALYTRGLYSPHLPGAAERAEALRTWRRLRQRLWLSWAWQKLSPTRLSAPGVR